MPGPLGASASVGTNALIATGAAKALTGAAMLLEALGVPPPAVATEDRDEIAMRVLNALAAGPADPDALARRLGMNGPAFATVIARLLIRGHITTAADGRLARR